MAGMFFIKPFKDVRSQHSVFGKQQKQFPLPDRDRSDVPGKFIADSKGDIRSEHCVLERILKPPGGNSHAAVGKA